MPFDFDPLALDFPALTLQCLQPPPTLFSSTQHATSTSWSVQSPGKREFGALQAFFQEEFSNWKVKCAAATTAVMEELTYPPSSNPSRDTREAIKRAEKSAVSLEKQVEEHLDSAYSVWKSLPSQRQQELWVLELARGVGRKHKEMEALKEQHYRSKQENAHLKMQVDQLNRLQQPREFKLLPPSAIPIDRNVISHAYGQGVRGAKTVGLSMEDRHVDIGSVVTNVIERWKNVITSTRVATTGLAGQRPLDQGAQTSSGVQSPPAQPAMSASAQNTPPAAGNAYVAGQTLETPSNSRINDAASGQTAPSAESSASPSVNDEMSEQDADAEMDDDDGFDIMGASPTKQSTNQMRGTNIDVPRTHGQLHQQAATPEMHFMMQSSAGSPAGGPAMAMMSRSMPNMNTAMQGSHMQSGDINMMHQVHGDTMYME